MSVCVLAFCLLGLTFPGLIARMKFNLMGLPLSILALWAAPPCFLMGRFVFAVYPLAI
jgi:hypothetical protein